MVAGGRGVRAQTDIPKQYACLGGRPILRRTLEAIAAHPQIDAVLCVIGEPDLAAYADASAGVPKLLPPVTGGRSRQASVRAGLEALAAKAPQKVLIHDAARPFISHKTLTALLETLDHAEGAIAALPVADTLKRQSTAGGIDATVPRDGLWRAATPQGFRFETILNAHRSAEPDAATDDAALLEAENIHVALIPDDPRNFKITYKEDFALAESLIAATRETRTGFGFDVHAFEPGDAVILGGVTIPHSAKLKGHSDADVVLHALCDAIFGGLALGDIGTFFPPSDEKWRGAPSDLFAKAAMAKVAAAGATLVHVDLTIIAEAPKIGPHRDAMRERIADILSLEGDRISVKATTTEGLGFTGRREGIACQAVVTLSVERDS
ncbi:hypothetical protein PB2503_09349 [Parvularcula bermudensis HTCC2503]|uniref:Bifunctional enzyme IspD/IspF n=1 Tax=Parvularcula bermudensis (strain ATCC BAA-594 / HTCC2503 / KCTC 12087) TaxID=314260 RepID=E0TDA0_PARBH|nr:hypothetical protein PB2503_09349 [Parvularcula bermudensis HTCC2503]